MKINLFDDYDGEKYENYENYKNYENVDDNNLMNIHLEQLFKKCMNNSVKQDICRNNFRNYKKRTKKIYRKLFRKQNLNLTDKFLFASIHRNTVLANMYNIIDNDEKP